MSCRGAADTRGRGHWPFSIILTETMHIFSIERQGLVRKEERVREEVVRGLGREGGHCLPFFEIQEQQHCLRGFSPATPRQRREPVTVRLCHRARVCAPVCFCEGAFQQCACTHICVSVHLCVTSALRQLPKSARPHWLCPPLSPPLVLLPALPRLARPSVSRGNRGVSKLRRRGA